jgi:ribosomal protein S6--L-glutamate ligase/tetrahydromethanopterin:alpha-L-glutamate ligase
VSLKIGIAISTIGQKLRWHELQLKYAFDKKKISTVFFPIKDTIANYSRFTLGVNFNNANLVKELNGVLVRGPGIGVLEQIYFRMNVVRMFEDSGVYVINSATAIERASDKLFTSMALGEAHILVPPTIVTQKIDQAMDFLRNYKDIVIKPLFGSRGKGITRICDEDTAYLIFEALEQFNLTIYLQKFIPHGNRDIRALVIDDQVIAAMYRVVENNGWKTNVSLGATPEFCELSDKLEKICVRAAQIIGCEIAGIDIMIPENEQEPDYYVLEVNACPAWEGLQKTTTLNIAEAITDYIATKM